jgi:uncharacterized membrane protein
VAAYRKFYVALIGAVLIGINEFFGISLGFNAEGVMAILIPILTALGVWATPNES